MPHTSTYDWLLNAEEDAKKYEDYNVRLAARIMKDYYEGAESEIVVAYCAKEKNNNKIQFFTYSEEQCLQNIQKYPNLECVCNLLGQISKGFMTNFNNKYLQKLSEDCGLHIQDGCEATIKEVEYFTEQAIKDAFARFDGQISWLRKYFENTPDLDYLTDAAKVDLKEMMGKS